MFSREIKDLTANQNEWACKQKPINIFILIFSY
jgi:hypothetical protein